MTPIPVEKRSPALKPSLRSFTKTVFGLLGKEPQLRYEFANLFSDITQYWFFSESSTEEEKAFVENGRTRFIDLGFNGASVKSEIANIFDEDSHLRSCCTTPWMLCVFLGRFFVNTSAVEFHDRGQFDGENFDKNFDAWANEVYATSLKVTLVSHLFNFDSEIDEFDIAGSKVKRLNKWEARTMFDNAVLSQLYHPDGVGDFFILTPVTADTIDITAFWETIRSLNEQLDVAVSIFQYLKDGHVYRDYSFLDFEPRWVKALYPAVPLGEPHRFPYANGNSFYTLRTGEHAKASEWLSIYTHQTTQSRLEDKTSNLLKAIMVAIEFFDSSFPQKDEGQRLIHLMVALEALYSPDDQKELSFRIRQYASQLLGTTPEERAKISGFLKKIYSVRSKLVHGSLNIEEYYDNTLITSEENDELTSIIRRSVLRYLVLFLSGRVNLSDGNKPQPIHRELESAALDDSVGEALRAQSDPEKFVKEFLSKEVAKIV